MPIRHQIASVSLDAELLEEARKLDIDASDVAERALRHTIRERISETKRAELVREFQKENAEAFQYSNEYVERNGLPLSKYRQF